jgi:hypothetical protein
MTLTPDTITYLQRLIADDRDFGPPDNASACKQATRELDALRRPIHYTLRQGGAEGWVVGALDGIHLPSPSSRAGASEVSRGLAALELAVTWQGDQVRLDAFLPPGEPLTSALHSARSMITRTRRWVGNYADATLGNLLEAVEVHQDASGLPVAVYLPAPDAPPIHTGFNTPP